MKPSSGTDVLRAIASLCERNVVLIPTETQYVLACNATDPLAVSQLRKIAGTQEGAVLEIFAASFERLQKFVCDVPEVCKSLAARFTPGLLGYLLPAKHTLSNTVSFPEGRTAIRVPSHPLTLSLLDKCQFPVAIAPLPEGIRNMTLTAEEIAEFFSDAMGYALDGGPSSIGPDATLIAFEPDAIVMHRKGAVSARSIEKTSGMLMVNHISPILPRTDEAMVVPFRIPAR